jgi:parallel beta-helix repeat protein
MANSDFITIIGPEDRSAVLRSLKVVGASHWRFKNLKVQANRPASARELSSLTQISGDSFHGMSDNIIVETSSFSSQEDVSGWSGADWVNKPYMYVFSTRSRCTTLTGSHFYNVRNAVELAGDDSLVEDNLIERFGNDGIDVIASNLIVRRNTIRDSRHTPAEPMHPDAIQGWTLRNATNRNILIDGNLILNPNTSDDNALQGISIFDGLWDGVRIVNNVVASNIWHGIALYGVENAEVINNTVVPVRPGKYMTWIAINPSKLRKPSSNIIVRNNIAGQIFASGQDIAVDHNIAAGPIKPAPVRAGMAPDRLTFANNMTGVPLESLFVDFDIPRAKLNFHLAPNSLARMAGSKENAPPVDRDGRPRVVPYDIGAYAR